VATPWTCETKALRGPARAQGRSSRSPSLSCCCARTRCSSFLCGPVPYPLQLFPVRPSAAQRLGLLRSPGRPAPRFRARVRACVPATRHCMRQFARAPGLPTRRGVADEARRDVHPRQEQRHARTTSPSLMPASHTHTAVRSTVRIASSHRGASWRSAIRFLCARVCLRVCVRVYVCACVRGECALMRVVLGSEPEPGFRMNAIVRRWRSLRRRAGWQCSFQTSGRCALPMCTRRDRSRVVGCLTRHVWRPLRWCRHAVRV
jgi:hypothetical protein